jgi:hypothetical protein
MATYRLMDGVAGRPGLGSTGTQPPAGVNSGGFSGNYVAGLVFEVTSGGMWFEGYYWWVPGSGAQTTAGQKFALWQVTGANAGTFLTGSAVTAGTLTAGQWNFVPLAAPLAIAPGAAYCAATGYTSTTGFPDTVNQFGSGNPYSAGITNGPLSAFSSSNGSNPAGGIGHWIPQQPFSTAGADPSVTLPTTNNVDDLLWLDVQVTDQAPVGASYRAWPNMPTPGTATPQNLSYTLAMEFSVSTPCKFSKIWHYSPPTSTVLPTRCALWNMGTQTVVPGTDNTSPTWLVPGGGAASAGAGWIYCDYSGAGIALAVGTKYKVSTFANAGSSIWFSALANYWTTSGLGLGGITAGPLTVPDNAHATAPGQDSWNQGNTWTYPLTSTNPENDWVDVEVTPVASGSGLMLATFP